MSAIDSGGKTGEDPAVPALDLQDVMPDVMPDERTPTTLLTSTWAALLAPRRLVPILVIAGPLAVTQAYTGATVLETAFLWLLCVAFVLVGPASWRLLLPPVRLPPTSFIARVGAYAVVGACAVWFFGAALPWLVTRGHDSSGLPRLDISGAVTITLWWVGGWGLGRDVESEVGLVAERRRSQLLHREAESARLLALKNHLDPHFLFNTLNAIAEWCRTDGEVAERAILQLSSMLRVILEGVKQPTWPLVRELELLSSLFSLYQMRDPELFTWSIAVDDGANDALVPPLLLLPLGENAMKHGPARGHRGAVSVAVVIDAGAVVVVVENPGAFAGRRDGGDGLAIVEGRASLVGGSVVVETVAGDRTRATLRLPPAARP